MHLQSPCYTLFPNTFRIRPRPGQQAHFPPSEREPPGKLGLDADGAKQNPHAASMGTELKSGRPKSDTSKERRPPSFSSWRVNPLHRHNH